MFRTKKSLGQHFLKEESIAKDIANALILDKNSTVKVLEVGPGQGMLTQHLVKRPNIDLTLIELDHRLPTYLKEAFPALEKNIIEQDVLKFDFDAWTDQKVALIGNYPYNISSQILFKVIENRHKIEQMVGMFQKEVAQRICSGPGTKAYGVLSVLTQVYYKTHYLFEVPPEAFDPPPKVMSAVIRLERTTEYDDLVDYHLFRKIVKTAFNQRRKKLSNALKSLNMPLDNIPEEVLHKRPDKLGVEEYLELMKILSV